MNGPLRRLQERLEDGGLRDWWVNPAHVVEVVEVVDASLVDSWVVTTRNTTRVKGACGDVAKELNGYWDER